MKKIPVTVLTGYLGAGKTTLLNRVLSAKHDKKFAVIINEFGEVGIDSRLVVSADEEIIVMNNGCICCTVRGDLIRTLENLFEREGDLDHVLIETTGLADPGPVLQTFLVDVSMRERLTLDALIAVVDAKHISLHWDSDEAVEQIAFADVILVNKTDLVTEAAVDELEQRIRAINAIAKIYRTRDCDIDFGTILDVNAFDLANALRIDPDLLSEDTHAHDESVTSIAITGSGAIDGNQLNRWLNELVQARGPDIFRIKGILELEDEDRRFVLHGVHMTLEGRPGRAWQPGEARRNELVFIGRHLDESELRKGFEACLSLPDFLLSATS
ncbi:CobW family GTP-binding protein [Methylohalobius crimeensis]|uniref:CobW family GTP-binding protein n=1 Tax=Methylohalobius crimeensis TaxID=244365 RepID=UPI0003B6E0F3|nr:GTP-binding protein [Methylohalobius crimeensis]